MASPILNNLIKSRQGLGIMGRAAENYGKKYEELLQKKFKQTGKTASVCEVTYRIITKCRKDNDEAFLKLLNLRGFSDVKKHCWS